jgi:hypothetical protein
MTLEEKLKDVKENPAQHRHTFDELQRCCFHGGALDTRLMAAHETYAAVGSNGGRTCDVTSGPCSCGAWHR